MLFSYGKTIVSDLRDRENTLKMEQKAPRSHQKTVREQEKEEIEKRTAFGPVLDQFWRSFGTQNDAEKSSKRRTKIEPKTEPILTPIWIPVGEGCRGAGGMRWGPRSQF